jgi:hypothetical protein
MTNLVVKPIDLSAEGSYRERRRFLRLIKQLQGLKEADIGAALEVLDEADSLLNSRLRTDDGTSVDDALDKLSAKQFDQLLSAIAFEDGVGEASAVLSTSGTEGTARKSRTGKSK